MDHTTSNVSVCAGANDDEEQGGPRQNNTEPAAKGELPPPPLHRQPWSWLILVGTLLLIVGNCSRWLLCHGCPDFGGDDEPIAALSNAENNFAISEDQPIIQEQNGGTQEVIANPDGNVEPAIFPSLEGTQVLASGTNKDDNVQQLSLLLKEHKCLHKSVI
ncbi:expressed unknown protein [Seminavis robusta]|uniref:Uncharacterized protein n=1 Tax=Seminavis robusta TaxID=568900 RepID=A0A9N8E2Q2_9STRA|nr:expressed unknown protein [Seminavis robusta]|eukprot:Sro557_g166190.1 n/a (161) ;mRNA; r:44302-44784